MARVDEIVDGIYRLSTTVHFEGLEFQFNQFLIDDERPALIHTGMHPMYEDVRQAVSEVLDPSTLGYGWNYRGRVEGHHDGEVIDLGKRKLRFLETPHVHQWDSMMLYEETTGSLFPSDLFLQPGDQPPVVSEDLGPLMCGYYREIGIFAHEEPVRQVAERIERLDPAWIHPMHGGSFARETAPHFTHALREEPFAYQGKLLGRELPSDARAASG